MPPRRYLFIGGPWDGRREPADVTVYDVLADGVKRSYIRWRVSKTNIVYISNSLSCEEAMALLIHWYKRSPDDTVR